MKSNIQFDQLKIICQHQSYTNTIDKIEFKDGDIVAHDGHVAFRLNFKVSYDLSVLLDRKGDLINFITRSQDNSKNNADLILEEKLYIEKLVDRLLPKGFSLLFRPRYSKKW